MAIAQTSPWRFTIEFDERKATAHGTTVDELYDRVFSVRSKAAIFITSGSFFQTEM
jgi:hypothetical protein